MYKQKRPPNRSNIKVNTSYEGETIEKKVARITNNKEPITDGAPLIYTDRKMGVQPEYDIRTDRFEIAVEAMDKVSKAQRAKREPKIEGIKIDESLIKKEGGGASPTETTTQE